MTESHFVPSSDGQEPGLYLSGQPGRGSAEGEQIKVSIASSSIQVGNFAVSALETHADELRFVLEDNIREGKSVRIDKLKLSSERDLLKKRRNELKKARLNREAELASRKSRLHETRSAVSSDKTVEMERQERRVAELEADIEAFTETLNMHRRDRDRVFLDLCEAQNKLQDHLTQRVLDKIVELEETEDSDPGRAGLSGLSAEFLGRLLVLEKEESRLGGLICRSKGLETK